MPSLKISAFLLIKRTMFKSSSTKFMCSLGLLLSLTSVLFTYACSNDAESVKAEPPPVERPTAVKSLGAADAAYSGQCYPDGMSRTAQMSVRVRGDLHFTSNQRHRSEISVVKPAKE